MPDVPMFTATPAKQQRRQKLIETLVDEGQTIANGLTPAEAASSQRAEAPTDQVTTFIYFSNLLLSQVH